MTAPTISPDVLAGISTACGFTPAVVRVFSIRPVNAEIRRDRVTVVVPVPKGRAATAFSDPAVESALAAGAVVVLAFKLRADARHFARLLAGVKGNPPCVHPMPERVQ